jgi:hypothetical protein
LGRITAGLVLYINEDFGKSSLNTFSFSAVPMRLLAMIKLFLKSEIGGGSSEQSQTQGDNGDDYRYYGD